MVGIALRDTPEAVRKFASEFETRFPLWVDPAGESLSAFGLRGHPGTVLIDPAGRIVGRIRGERDWGSAEARQLVEWLLARPG
jgi:peroxiredoxin